MKSSVDRLSFHNLGFKGKEVVLTKFMHQRHIEDYFSPTHLERFVDSPLPKEKTQEKIPYQVKSLKSKQAIEVAQCAYRTYGYTYVMENVYYPEWLVQMIQTGDIVSAVAVSEVNGEVMAHCALEFHGRKHGIPEIGMAFTKPKYRHMGCLNSLNVFMLDHAQKNRAQRYVCQDCNSPYIFSKGRGHIWISSLWTAGRAFPPERIYSYG